ncbi:MAG: glycosyltransferase family 2 protein [Mycobacterium sp.]
MKRLLLVRVLALLVVSLGIGYLGWRWSSTIAWDVWWIAVPLVLAETYSLSESVLYGLTMWNARRRPSPPQAPEGKTVDVFIATYNEPLEIVLRTAVAARDITYPHQTWILDDGDRAEFARAAEILGVGYINRGPEWEGRPRFAKAGNVNNALFQTSGEFIAVLDADQVPQPEFLDHVLGYFDDPEVAFVQTPQRFWNVPDCDPLGSQADLFYGPIQQGKDGMGAAFFCGSNAVLRREALMALGLTRFCRAAAERVRRELRRGRGQVEAVLGGLSADQQRAAESALSALRIIKRAEARIRTGDVLADITYELRRRMVELLGQRPVTEPLGHALVQIVERADVARTDHALAIDPITTSSITEDMATAMHLHALGWTSVYHHEVLVHGLAPEDVSSMLTQRQRWATGTMQVFFRDNPLFIRGLTVGQRLMYLATMTSYLNGFAAVVYIAAPIVFLTTGVFPIHTDTTAFFVYFMPFFLMCQLLFVVAGNGSRGLWRGQQMSFALFPVWIKATIAGAGAAFFGKTLKFKVTSKTRADSGRGLRYVRPQLIAITALTIAAGVGVIAAAHGARPMIATQLTLAWVAIDIALLWSMVRAARYGGPSAGLSCPIDHGVREEAERTISQIVTEQIVADAARVVSAVRHEGLEPTGGRHRCISANASAIRCDVQCFDASAALELRQAVADAAPVPVLFIDVSGVASVTPSGVAVMLDLLRMVRARGGELRLFGASGAFERAHKVLELAGVTSLHSDHADASRRLELSA